MIGANTGRRSNRKLELLTFLETFYRTIGYYFIFCAALACAQQTLLYHIIIILYLHFYKRVRRRRRRVNRVRRIADARTHAQVIFSGVYIRILHRADSLRPRLSSVVVKSDFNYSRRTSPPSYYYYAQCQRAETVMILYYY